MPLYTLYPSLPDGSSTSFKAVELRSDGAARATAQALLAEHGSAVGVVIWRGDRRVGALRRALQPAE